MRLGQNTNGRPFVVQDMRQRQDTTRPSLWFVVKAVSAPGEVLGQVSSQVKGWGRMLVSRPLSVHRVTGSGS